MGNVIFHPEADAEYQDSLAWYQRRNPTAARGFRAAVNRVLAAIAAQPDRYGWYEPPFREAILIRYPYSVIHRVDDAGNVLVVAVAHASRETGLLARSGVALPQAPTPNTLVT